MSNLIIAVLIFYSVIAVRAEDIANSVETQSTVVVTLRNVDDVA